MVLASPGPLLTRATPFFLPPDGSYPVLLHPNSVPQLPVGTRPRGRRRRGRGTGGQEGQWSVADALRHPRHSNDDDDDMFYLF